MEVVYQNNTGKTGGIQLPRNIKQYGNDNGNKKIYIEDYVYTFINDLRQDEYEEGVTGLLLGEVCHEGDNTYIFVRGAIEVTNAAVFKDKIAFTDETWPVTKVIVNQYFPGYEIVGWYLNSKNINEGDMPVIDKSDRESFQNEDGVFVLVNPDIRDNAVYSKTDSGLAKNDGYCVFFERNEAMQTYMNSIRKQHMAYRKDSDAATGRYRSMVKSKQQPMSKNMKKHLTILYGLSMLLVVIVLIIGVNSINGFKKNSAVDKPLDVVDNQTPGVTTPVEDATGNIDDSTEATTETPTEEPTEPPTEAPTEAPTEPPTEAPTEKPTDPPAKQEYTSYTVVAGDSLSSIAKKMYGSGSLENINLIKEANNLTDNNILVGQVLKIPNK